MDHFPPNSKASKGPVREPVQRVTQADAVRRKPGLGKKFAQTFIGGDARTAWDYMVWDVAVPEIKNMMVDALQSGVERFFHGTVRPRSRGGGPNPYGYVAYNQMSRGRSVHDDRPPMPTRQQLSRPARARHDFDEIILQTRPDAEEALESMKTILDSQYEVVTVADLYELVGIKPDHTDTRWGWTNLKDAGIGRIRGLGYVLDLPDPEPLQ